MHVPAICDNCGTVFGAGGIELGPGARLEISGVTMGPCPNCGGAGHAVDGLYESVGNGLRILSSAGPEALGWLQASLLEMREHPVGAAEAADRVDSAIPGLTDVFPWMRQAPSREALERWILVLLAIVQIAIALSSRSEPVPTDQTEIHNITIQVIEKADEETPPPAP